jgi:WD40 repeat protein
VPADGDADLVARLTGHNNTIVALAWAPAGDTIVSADIDGVLKRWSVDRIDPTAYALDGPGDSALVDLDLSPDGRWLAAGNDEGGVAVWDLESNRLSKALPVSKAEIRSLRWHATKPWIAAADEDGWVTVLSFPDGEVVEDRQVDVNVIDVVRWLPGGNGLVAGTLGGAIRLWPLGGQVVDFNGTHPEPVLALAVMPETDRLLSTDAEGNLWLWDLKTRERIAMAWAPAGLAVDALSVSHDGNLVLTAGNDGVLHIYQLDSPGEPINIGLGGAQIVGAAWSPDDQLIAAVDTEANLKVWSVEEGEMFVSIKVRSIDAGVEGAGAEEFARPRRIVWLPDGATIATGSSVGQAIIVKLDADAWLARAKSVFPPAAAEVPPGGDAD